MKKVDKNFLTHESKSLAYRLVKKYQSTLNIKLKQDYDLTYLQSTTLQSVQ